MTPETVLAAFLPPPRTAAGAPLLPITLAHLLALHYATPELFTEHPNVRPTLATYTRAAAILTTPATRVLARAQAPANAQSKHSPRDLTATDAQAIRDHIAAAFAPFLRPKSSQRKDPPIRLGLITDLLRFRRAECHLSHHEALNTIPVPQIFLLLAATHAANGGKFAAPDYTSQDTITQLQNKPPRPSNGIHADKNNAANTGENTKNKTSPTNPITGDNTKSNNAQ